MWIRILDHAKALPRRGIDRLSVDEQVIARHGRLCKDYPEAEHLALLAPVIDEVKQQLIDLNRNGQSVVLDHGLGSKAEEDAWSPSRAVGGG